MNESCNPLVNVFTPNENVQTPHDETNDNMTDEIPEDRNNRLKSIVWDYFTKVKVDEKEKTKCNYCKKLFGERARDENSHLRGHMKISTPRLNTMGHNNEQIFLTAKVLQGKKELVTGIYDAENARKELAHAIILHEYPLSIVEHIGFRRYSVSLQPLFQVPCRNTIKKEIFKVYEVEKTIILKLLETLPQRVAITSDMWTASNKKKRFIYVPAPHTSKRLCKALVECLMDWNIDTKLSTITLDNCSTNDAIIEKIKDKLQLNTLLKDEVLLHMRCCAHILNLIVKDGLEVVKDGVERIQDSVAYWTATPKMKEKFEETVKQLRISCTKNLVLDCPTRWNSTYKMLDVAILYEDVFS
ncbi:zinc finger BED domain-containing protein RICESLEEPER 2-like [Cicer arietinum]|uniref:Zinc finger BED domain-containing protein RICESLEEPER 2-like n=1 Tax=Cicer arietinum TaxID=3827 RepID=A0A1S3E483_CICAR|nr:zinc finger BED domain-containing protein RICESLEEPER 2-like [Cicer arietinum]